MSGFSDLSVGLKCKACDASLNEDNDPELCKSCMAVVFQYNKQYLTADDELEDIFDMTELIDIENIGGFEDEI